VSDEDLDEKQRLAYEVFKAREELFQWNQRLNGPMGSTCEQKADEAKLNYLAAMLVQDEKGNRIWPSYESYLKEKNNDLSLKARFEVMLYLQGYESDFLEKTPEATAFRDIQEVLEKRTMEVLESTEDLSEDNNKDTKKKSNKKK
jgi:hypothetical protein